jgi:hypothetical protein
MPVREALRKFSSIERFAVFAPHRALQHFPWRRMFTADSEWAYTNRA